MMSVGDLLSLSSATVLNATSILLLIERLHPHEQAMLFEKLGVKNEEAFLRWFSSSSSTSSSNQQKDSYEQQLMYYADYRAHRRLTLWVPPVLLVVGTIGNLLSFLILSQRSMRKTSTYIYLAVLSITDMLVLLVGLLPLWITEITGYDIRTVNWVCKVINVVGYTVSDYSVWLIIAVTVERYIVVCFPLHASTMCNRRRALSVIVSLLALLFLINLHFMWTAAATMFPHQGELITQCAGAADFQTLVVDVWPWVDAFIYSFLPFAVISIFNALIILQVLRARRQRGLLQSRAIYQDQVRRHQQQESSYKLTVMLLTISFTFLLTTLPVNISLIATAFWENYNDDLEVVAKFTLVRTITALLMYTNHSINFFLYCATGLRFRQQLQSLIHCSKNRYRPPHTNSSRWKRCDHSPPAGIKNRPHKNLSTMQGGAISDTNLELVALNHTERIRVGD